METLLSVSNLSVGYKVYGGTTHVLRDVELTVGKGEKIGLIGESACGKTTTVKSVIRILPRNAVLFSGRIFFDGKDVFRMSNRELLEMRRKHVSMIFQDPSAALNPVFTIGEQLYDIIRYSSNDRLSKDQVHELAIQYLKQAALPEPERILTSYPMQLSGGMKQRVNIAMALVSANDLLIADEPGTALDVTIEDQIMKLLKKIVEEKRMSIILITHALGSVRHFVDRVYVMYAGTIVEYGPTDEVFRNPQHPYTKMLLQSVPKLVSGYVPEGIPGVVPSYLNPPTGCRFISRCPFAMEVCKQKPEMYEVSNNHFVSCFLYKR